MSLQNKIGFDQEGVSPVVGVILMVAITVILAAVIGTFVLGLGDQVNQNAQAGVTFDENAGVDVVVQLNSVQAADHIYVQASESGVSYSSSFGGTAYSEGPTDTNQYLISLDSAGDTEGGVGTTVTVDTSGSADGQLTVIGVLNGEENIIQTYEYNGGA